MKILNGLPVLLLLLNGCSGYSNHFACKPQDGLGCRSITEVNALVDKGWPNPAALPAQNPAKSWFSKTKTRVSISTEPSAHAPQPDARLYRTAPKTVRIWIAPYQDERDTYWDEQLIYRVSEEGHWVNADVLEKEKADE